MTAAAGSPLIQIVAVSKQSSWSAFSGGSCWLVAWNPFLAVPPSAVPGTLGRLLSLATYPDLPSHLLMTVREIVVAYALAVTGGLGVGAVLGLNRTAGRASAPSRSSQ